MSTKTISVAESRSISAVECNLTFEICGSQKALLRSLAIIGFISLWLAAAGVRCFAVPNITVATLSPASIPSIGSAFSISATVIANPYQISSVSAVLYKDGLYYDGTYGLTLTSAKTWTLSEAGTSSIPGNPGTATHEWSVAITAYDVDNYSSTVYSNIAMQDPSLNAAITALTLTPNPIPAIGSACDITATVLPGPAGLSDVGAYLYKDGNEYSGPWYMTHGSGNTWTVNITGDSSIPGNPGTRAHTWSAEAFSTDEQNVSWSTFSSAVNQPASLDAAVSSVTLTPNPIPALGTMYTVTAMVLPGPAGISSVAAQLYEDGNYYTTTDYMKQGSGNTWTVSESGQSSIPGDVGTAAHTWTAVVTVNDKQGISWSATSPGVAQLASLNASVTAVSLTPSPIPAAGTAYTITANVLPGPDGTSNVQASLYEDGNYFGALGYMKQGTGTTWTLYESGDNSIPANLGTALHTWTADVTATDNQNVSWTGSSAGVTQAANVTPTITSISPTSGSVGTLVTISGSNFAGATSVAFDGTSATFEVVNNGEITATVPSGASTGLISVTTPAGTASSPTDFTVTAAASPVVTSFTPTIGVIGTVVTVYGSGFAGLTAASINGLFAKSTFVNDGEITLTVPSGATTGPVHVRTVTGLGSSTTNFTVTSLAITSFAPAAAPVGTVVAVYGSGFTGVTAASVDGIPATFAFVGDGQVNVTVPVGADTGPIHIKVPTGLAVSPTNFTVTTLGITSFSPTFGPVGTIVKVSGSGFTGITAASEDGYPATFTFVSDGQVTFTVPKGAGTGVIHVKTPNGLVASATNFTVTTSAAVPAPTITPNGGAYLNAQMVTITSMVVGAKIHYTTDGSTPTDSSPLYDKSLPVESSLVVKAIAEAKGCGDSRVATAKFGIPTEQGMIALVTNLNDSGPGSLRAAIINANAEPGSIVAFATGLNGTISLSRNLPTPDAKTTIIWPAGLIGP
jgi:hypothetical protein